MIEWDVGKVFADPKDREAIPSKSKHWRDAACAPRKTAEKPLKFEATRRNWTTHTRTNAREGVKRRVAF